MTVYLSDILNINLKFKISKNNYIFIDIPNIKNTICNIKIETPNTKHIVL